MINPYALDYLKTGSASDYAMAFIHDHMLADSFEGHDGQSIKIYTWIPRKQVIFVHDGRTQKLTQEEFALERNRTIERIVGVINDMSGPTKGKGALLKRKAAAKQFCEMAFTKSEKEEMDRKYAIG